MKLRMVCMFVFILAGMNLASAAFMNGTMKNGKTVVSGKQLLEIGMGGSIGSVAIPLNYYVGASDIITLGMGLSGHNFGYNRSNLFLWSLTPSAAFIILSNNGLIPKLVISSEASISYSFQPNVLLLGMELGLFSCWNLLPDSTVYAGLELGGYLGLAGSSYDSGDFLAPSVSIGYQQLFFDHLTLDLGIKAVLENRQVLNDDTISSRTQALVILNLAVGWLF